jgi:hypothetical protein
MIQTQVETNFQSLFWQLMKTNFTFPAKPSSAIETSTRPARQLYEAPRLSQSHIPFARYL